MVPVVRTYVRFERLGSPQLVRTNKSTKVKSLICEFPNNLVLLEINLLASQRRGFVASH